MHAVSVEIPIYRVTEAGAVEHLGSWNHDARVLTLEREGFPLMRTGTHQIEGDLPWLFWDMCPSGFLGARLTKRHAVLGLPANPRVWGKDDALNALTNLGAELSGNLLVGARALQDYRDWQWNEFSVAEQLGGVLAADNDDAPSSLGGERPKMISQSEDGTEFLIKFSPPSNSTLGRRWGDLLHTEERCAHTLVAHGISAVQCGARRSLPLRTLLFVWRYDRLKGRGRRGASTLYWLAMDRWGDIQIPAPEVVRRLVASGELPEEDAITCDKVHAFSAAIGNNDAHLGNYGLVFDEAGRARLAPIYDVLPMIFAPRHDELPDQWVKPRASPIREDVRPMVEHLAQLISTDDNISREFKELWLRYVGL